MSLVRNIIEFLLGFLIISILAGFVISLFDLFLISALPSLQVVVPVILKVVILGGLFLLRKMVAIGYLASLILEVLSGVVIYAFF